MRNSETAAGCLVSRSWKFWFHIGKNSRRDSSRGYVKHIWINEKRYVTLNVEKASDETSKLGNSTYLKNNSKLGDSNTYLKLENNSFANERPEVMKK